MSPSLRAIIRVIWPGAAALMVLTVLAAVGLIGFFTLIALVDPSPYNPGFDEILVGGLCVVPTLGVLAALAWSGAALGRWVSVAVFWPWLRRNRELTLFDLLQGTAGAFVVDLWLLVPVGAACALMPALEDDPLGPVTMALLLCWAPAMVVSSVVEARGAANVSQRGLAPVMAVLVGGRLGVVVAGLTLLVCSMALFVGSIGFLEDAFWRLLEVVVSNLLWLVGMNP